MEGDHLLVFFTIHAVIEADHHPAGVQSGPLPDKNQVGDRERNPLGRRY